MCSSDLVPEKILSLPSVDVSFALTEEDFATIMKSANVLQSPNIAVESDGKKVNIVTLDLLNDSAHTDSLEIGDGNGDVYRMVFKTENINKLFEGSYDVQISSKGVSHFKHKKIPLEYWITTEAGSKFQKSE